MSLLNPIDQVWAGPIAYEMLQLSHAGGILSVEFPTGYVVPSPCDAHDLPHSCPM